MTLTLTGTSAGSTLSDGNGNYTFSSLGMGGTYTVTPSKTALPPGSAGISTVDLIAIQRHYLQIAFLSGCHLTAADVNSDTSISTVDVVATQRFFLGLTFGLANVGQYRFSPSTRTYPGVVNDQTNQDYATLILGDVTAPFAAP